MATACCALINNRSVVPCKLEKGLAGLVDWGYKVYIRWVFMVTVYIDTFVTMQIGFLESVAADDGSFLTGTLAKEALDSEAQGGGLSLSWVSVNDALSFSPFIIHIKECWENVYLYIAGWRRGSCCA